MLSPLGATILWPHVGYGTRGVVCECLDDDRDSAWSVPLVGHFVIVDTLGSSARFPFFTARSMFSLGMEFWRAVSTRRAQTRIATGIAAAQLCGHRDFTNKLSWNSAPRLASVAAL